MSDNAVLAALHHEIAKRYHEHDFSLTSLKGLFWLVLDAVRAAERTVTAQPRCGKCGGLFHTTSECRAPVDVPCNRYVNRMVHCQRAYGHTGGCEFPGEPPIITPADLRDGIGTELRGVWHLNDKTYQQLRAWETWGREVAIPAIERQQRYCGSHGATLGAAMAARPKDST